MLVVFVLTFLFCSQPWIEFMSVFQPTTPLSPDCLLARLHRYKIKVWVISLPVLLLISGCTTDPAAVQQIFPFMPSSLSEAPPPGIQLMLASERARLFGAEALAAAQAAQAQRTIDTTITPPDVVALDAPIDEAENTATERDAVESTQIAETARVDLPRAQVVVSNRSVNVRSGPGLDFDVVGGAVEGTTFEAMGLSEDGNWWRICCVTSNGEVAEDATERAWISSAVVLPNAEAVALPVIGPIFPADLQAQWAVNYACGSDRCEVDRCTAQIVTDVRNADNPQWLEIERNVRWADGCGEDSSWLHQIDRTEGTERYNDTSNLFLFNFWAGVEPGPINSLFSLNSDAQVKTWCSDEQIIELEEGNGWTARYNGMTCHDVRTGMLVSMKYTKRWLFSGTFEDEEYQKAYFGDYEVYEVRLDETNIQLDRGEPACHL